MQVSGKRQKENLGMLNLEPEIFDFVHGLFWVVENLSLWIKSNAE